MKIFGAAAVAALALMLVPMSTRAAPAWVEGTHYELITPAVKTSVPSGKVEVLEVFSYACPFCNRFQPMVRSLQRNLPSTAQMAFLPAAFNPSEDWPMFQRAYFTAQALGVADRTHQEIYDAIWETGELGLSDPATGTFKKPLPSIEDAAKVYERLTGVRAQVFLVTARSAAIDQKMQAADAQIVAMKVIGTPDLVVNGKYRIIMESMRSDDDLVDVVHFLVDKESKH